MPNAGEYEAEVNIDEHLTELLDSFEKSARAEIARLYREAGVKPSDELVSRTFSNFSNALRREVLDGDPRASAPEAD